MQRATGKRTAAGRPSMSHRPWACPRRTRLWSRSRPPDHPRAFSERLRIRVSGSGTSRKDALQGNDGSVIIFPILCMACDRRTGQNARMRAGIWMRKNGAGSGSLWRSCWRSCRAWWDGPRAARLRIGAGSGKASSSSPSPDDREYNSHRLRNARKEGLKDG